MITRRSLVFSISILMWAQVSRAQEGTALTGKSRDSVITYISVYGAGVTPSEMSRSADGGPPDFVPVEQQPKLVHIQDPEHPPFARWDSTDGKTWVKVWVGKEGNPKKAILLKSTDDIYDLPSIDAAMTSRFNPATQGGKPVDVWTVIPFRFEKKIHNGTQADTVSEAAVKMNEIVDNLELTFKLVRISPIDSASYAAGMAGYSRASQIYENYRIWSESYSRYAKSLLRTAERNLQMQKNSMVGHK